MVKDCICQQSEIDSAIACSLLSFYGFSANSQMLRNARIKVEEATIVRSPFVPTFIKL